MRKKHVLSIAIVIILFVLFGSVKIIGEEVNSLSLFTNKLDVDSEAGIMLDLDNGETISEKSADQKIYPASITKVMTAIVALENIQDLGKPVVIDGEIINMLNVQNASMAGFEPGEQTTVRSLLYATLLSSGGDAAITLANLVSGTEAGFVVMMNEKAEQLGMTDTQFTNCTGLHNDNHYTTVRDLSLLLRNALQDEDFRYIFTRESYTDEKRTYVSTLFSKIQDQGYITGGKTGYTPEAGLCLASTASKNGKNYLLITTGADGDPHGTPNHIIDAQNVYSEI